jgi:hypothetical protein
MRSLEDMSFHVVKHGDRYIGKVIEFPSLRSRPHTNRLDALDEIITITRDRIREIHQTREQHNADAR